MTIDVEELRKRSRESWERAAPGWGRRQAYLRPGGRVALSVWDRPDLNPWAIMTPIELVERGAMPPPDPEAPGMFALADRDKLVELLAEAGFSEIEIDAVELEQQHPSFDAMW